MQLRYKALLNLPKNLGKRTKTAKNTENMIIFHKFDDNSSLPISIIKQQQKKTIGNLTSCSSLIILCNWGIRHSLTCLKTWGKGSKRLKPPKKIFFRNFEYSSLATLVIKQNKNNWARKYMRYLFYFIQF